MPNALLPSGWVRKRRQHDPIPRIIRDGLPYHIHVRGIGSGNSTEGDVMTVGFGVLWEWVDLPQGARIYRFGEAGDGAGFIIGGLKPSQAKQIVEHHNLALREVEHTKMKGADNDRQASE